MPFPTEGGCLCGAVRYRISAPPIASMHCHCTNCRRSSGAGILTFVTVGPEAFEWTSGEPHRYRYESELYGPVERLFCAGCGAQLGWSSDGDPTVDLTAGSLDDPTIVEPQYHNFTRTAVGWLHFDDDLPRYESRKDS